MPFPLVEFLLHLQEHKLAIGIASHQQCLNIISHFLPSGIPVENLENRSRLIPSSLDEVCQLICPVIIKNQSEQEKFYRVSSDFFHLFNQQLSAQSSPIAHQTTETAKKTSWKTVIAVLLVYSSLIALLYFYTQKAVVETGGSATKTAAGKRTDSDKNVSPELTYRQNVAKEPYLLAQEGSNSQINYLTLITFLGFSLLAYVSVLWLGSRKTKISRNTKPPHFLLLPNQDGLIKTSNQTFLWARDLKHRKESKQKHIDIGASIKKSLKTCGFTSIVYRQNLNRNKYLFLIDFNFYDQQSFLYKTLIDFFDREGVELNMFYFRDDLRYCQSAGYESGISLKELSIIFPEHDVVIFSDGSHLIDYQSGQLKAWVEPAMESWAKRVILTPNPFLEHSFVEQALSPFFALFPSSPSGWSEACNYLKMNNPDFSSAERYRHEQLPARPNPLFIKEIEAIDEDDLINFFNQPAIPAARQGVLLQWAYSTTLYPTPNWEVTIAIGLAIEKAAGVNALVNFENLMLISPLPWLKCAQIPFQLRQRLTSLVDKSLKEPVLLGIESLLARTILVGNGEDSLAGMERKIRLFELHAQSSDPAKAKTAISSLMVYHQSGLIDDELTRSRLTKKIQQKRWTVHLLLLSLIAIAFILFKPLLISQHEDLAAYHNNLAVKIANADPNFQNANTADSVVSQLRRSVASKTSFEAFYNLQALNYNLQIKSYQAPAVTRYPGLDLSPSASFISQLFSSIRMIKGEGYIPSADSIKHYLKLIYRSSSAGGKARIPDSDFGSNFYQGIPVELKQTFEAQFYNSDAYNPYSLTTSKPALALQLAKKQITQKQLDALILLHAKLLLLYSGGPKIGTREMIQRWIDRDSIKAEPAERKANQTPAGKKPNRNEYQLAKAIPTQLRNAKQNRSLSSYATDTISMLFKPLLDYFAESKLAYQHYTEAGYSYQFASELYQLDLNLIKLITAQRKLISNQMQANFDLLETHLRAWTNEFKRMEDARTSTYDKEKFQVIYTGPTFESVKPALFQAEYERLRAEADQVAQQYH